MPEPTTQDEGLESELEKLRADNQVLSRQVKRLLKNEHDLGVLERQLEAQIRVYRQLYEIGSKLNATLELAEVLSLTVQFVLYELNFERCLVLLPSDETGELCVQASDGYYDEDASQAVTELCLSRKLLPSALKSGSRRVIYPAENEDEQLTSLSRVFGMDEYVILALGGDSQVLPGLLVVGNTADNLSYYNRIEPDSETMIPLANLAGLLTGALNSVSSYHRLEERVVERTRDLAAATEVARAAASILDTAELIQQVVELIREQFDLYYVGLFLLDEQREWAVLRAGTGEAGRAMLARGHRLAIGGGSMIGWSIANARARVAQVATEDAERLATTELPETRAEAALPLRSREQVLGALTVQSREPGAFDEELLTVLQTMVDQVAVALDNARLFHEAQEALEAERRAYGEISREAWQELLRDRPEWGYRYVNQAIVPIKESQSELMQATQRRENAQAGGETGQEMLAIPLKVRDQAVGMLRFRKDSAGQTWTADERELLDALADQLGQALESARLYQDTQRRAAHEQALGEVTARFSHSLDMHTVLQTAVRELGQVLGVDEVAVYVGNPEEDRERA